MTSPYPPRTSPSRSEFSLIETPQTAASSTFAASTTYLGSNQSQHFPGDGKRETGSSFRDSTHLIPSIVDNKAQKFHPLILSLPIAIGVPIIMFALGLALEAGIAVSNRDQGFEVPEKNVLSFASAQFLQSFVPTLLIVPVGFLWRELDWYIRLYQPYVVLSRGNAPADESLLNDYIGIGAVGSLVNSLRFRHRLIFWSALMAVISFSLQPLAGSIFQVQQRLKERTDVEVDAKRRIGLSPNGDLTTAFVAAAGYAEAAVYANLGDPPFVRDGWTIAEFGWPKLSLVNGTLRVNTTSIQSKVSCETPQSVKIEQTPPNITAVVSTSIKGCTVSVPVDPKSSTQQFGVADASCITEAHDVTLVPVMFWFMQMKDQNQTPDVKAVFCSTTLGAFRVAATSDLGNKTLSGLDDAREEITNDPTNNNVTTGAFAGKAFNGLLFPVSTDPLVQARSLATRSLVPHAIFQSAAKRSGGLQAEFDEPNGFLDKTQKIYTQHLSLAARNVYFVEDNYPIPAKIFSLVPRLVISPLPAHFMAVNMMLIGMIGLVVQLVHRQQRKRLFLAAPPGTIASVMALSSHSGFGQLLMPFDNEDKLHEKLSGLRYGLDRRTGALVADEAPPPSLSKMKKERDEALQTLLGEHSTSRDVNSSSQAAFESANGNPPWQRQYRTPYEP